MPHPSATSRPTARLPFAGAFAFALAAALPAQGWSEVGDAGNLQASTTTVGPLPTRNATTRCTRGGVPNDNTLRHEVGWQ